VRLAGEIQARNGGINSSSTGNAFEGNIGVDYMGFSIDFVGGKIFDSVGIGGSALAASIISAANAAGISPGYGFVPATVSDNTVFQVAAKYTIGPWKMFGGYEWIQYQNPNNPLNPGAIVQDTYVAPAPNNANFTNNKVLQTAWVGVRYSITPALDITGAYYHEWQNSFGGAADGAVAGYGAVAGCSDARSSKCSGSIDAVSLVLDWRFARHVDVFAGVMWSQVNNGLANGFLLANGQNGTTALNPAASNHASSFDPGVGLRYQF
jgi:predicted porin